MKKEISGNTGVPYILLYSEQVTMFLYNTTNEQETYPLFICFIASAKFFTLLCFMCCQILLSIGSSVAWKNLSKLVFSIVPIRKPLGGSRS